MKLERFHADWNVYTSPALRGTYKVAAQSDAGEGRAASKTLTRLAALADLGPLFAAQAREERERCTNFQSA